MIDLEKAVRDLEARVRALEDELAVHRLIVRYGLAVDTGDAARTSAVFAADGLYDTDVLVMNGRAEIEAMIRGERHQGMVGRCAHQIGPAVVEVDSDRATAVGYSRVYLADGKDIGVYRVSVNRWELERVEGAWRIRRRITRLLGHDEARAVLAAGLDELSSL
jgi:hypothetical protein